MRPLHRFAMLAALALGGSAAVWLVRALDEGRDPIPSPGVVQTLGDDKAAPASAHPATQPAERPRVASTAADAAETEALRMRDLRRVFVSDPATALDDARALEQAYPNGAEAAERSWIEIRCLVSLRRFHDARDATLELVKRFPDSTWALDARAHLLVNPLDYPSREELAKRESSEP